MGAALSGCNGSGEPARSPRPASKQTAKTSAANPEGVPALAARRLASVPDGTFGPYLGVRPEAGVALWAAPKKGGRAFFARAFTGDKTIEIGPAPLEIGLLTLQPLGAGSKGFAAFYSDRREDGEHLFAFTLDASGQRVSEPVQVAETQGELLWVECLAASQGAVLLWALRDQDRADVYSTSLDSSGKAGVAPKLVADNVRAWQVAAVPAGVALVFVQADPKRSLGPVKLSLLDASGSPKAAAQVISAQASAQPDIDMVRSGDRLLIGWTDRRDLDAHVMLAEAELDGRLKTAATPIDGALGEQALLKLVRPFDAKGPAYLAWEDPGDVADGSRVVRLADIASGAKLGKARARLMIAASDGTIPELAASRDGLSAITLHDACPREGACAQPQALPTYAAFDRDLTLIATEPLRLAPLAGKPAALGWGLSCRADGCLALAAAAETPAPVYLVELKARSMHWRPAGGEIKRSQPPRAEALSTLTSLDPLADLTAVRAKGTTVAAWVSFFDPSTPWQRLTKPASDGRFDPTRARLDISSLAADGAVKSINVSLRARSLGGVSLAAHPSEPELLLGWSALDNKVPQVFLSLFSPDGKKLAQKMLTRSPGEVSDVAVAGVSDGYVVAWTDERSGDPELYATKVNRQLVRVAPEQRLTNKKGTATGVQLLRVGDAVLAAYADARDSAHPGVADIFVLRLAASDAKPTGPEITLAETAEHSFAPVLVRKGDHAAIGWIEAGKGDGPGSIRFGDLDANGRLMGPLLGVTADRGSPTGFTLECDAQRCRGVFSREGAAKGELLAFVSSGAAPSARPLLRLSGPVEQSALPVLVGGELIFGDQVDGQGRVRRLRIDWGD